MKIVNHKEFLALPKGIVYSTYKSLGMIEGLYEKSDTLPNKSDWRYQDFLGCVEESDDMQFIDIMFAAEAGSKFTIDLACEERDGCFDDSALFVIYDKADLLKLIQSLVQALDVYPTSLQ